MPGCECGRVILTREEVVVAGCERHQLAPLRLAPSRAAAKLLAAYLRHVAVQKALYAYAHGAVVLDAPGASRATVYRWLGRAGLPCRVPHRPHGSAPPRRARTVEAVVPPPSRPPFAPPYPGFPPEKQRWV